MKTYIIIRALWIPALSLGVYISSYSKNILNWICSHPTLWTAEFGYTPLVVIGGVLMVVVKKFRS